MDNVQAMQVSKLAQQMQLAKGLFKEWNRNILYKIAHSVGAQQKQLDEILSQLRRAIKDADDIYSPIDFETKRKINASSIAAESLNNSNPIEEDKKV